MYHRPENTGWKKSYSSLLLLSGQNPEQFHGLSYCMCANTAVSLSLSFCLCTSRQRQRKFGHRAALALSLLSRPASHQVTEYIAHTGERRMTYLNILQHYKPADHTGTEEVTDITGVLVMPFTTVCLL